MAMTPTQVQQILDQQTQNESGAYGDPTPTSGGSGGIDFASMSPYRRSIITNVHKSSILLQSGIDPTDSSVDDATIADTIYQSGEFDRQDLTILYQNGEMTSAQVNAALKEQNTTQGPTQPNSQLKKIGNTYYNYDPSSGALTPVASVDGTPITADHYATDTAAATQAAQLQKEWAALEEQKRQFGLTFDEQKRQFEITQQLDQLKFGETQRNNDATITGNRAQVGQSLADFTRNLANDAYTRAADPGNFPEYLAAQAGLPQGSGSPVSKLLGQGVQIQSPEGANPLADPRFQKLLDSLYNYGTPPPLSGDNSVGAVRQAYNTDPNAAQTFFSQKPEDLAAMFGSHAHAAGGTETVGGEDQASKEAGLRALAGFQNPDQVQQVLRNQQNDPMYAAIDQYGQSPLARSAMNLASHGLEGTYGGPAGDNGLALGPYQIRTDVHQISAQDANDPYKSSEYMSNDYNLAAERVMRENPGLWESDPARASALAAFYAERPTNMYDENRYRQIYNSLPRHANGGFETVGAPDHSLPTAGPPATMGSNVIGGMPQRSWVQPTADMFRSTALPQGALAALTSLKTSSLPPLGSTTPQVLGGPVVGIPADQLTAGQTPRFLAGEAGPERITFHPLHNHVQNGIPVPHMHEMGDVNHEHMGNNAQPSFKAYAMGGSADTTYTPAQGTDIALGKGLQSVGQGQRGMTDQLLSGNGPTPGSVDEATWQNLSPSMKLLLQSGIKAQLGRAGLLDWLDEQQKYALPGANNGGYTQTSYV